MNAPLVFPINGDALPGEIEPNPIKIDPRPCELCGRTIDQHESIDTGEGPEFFCFPDGHLVQEWELADPRDCWKHTGEPPPTAAVRNSDISARPADKPRPYRTPQATVDAFWFVVSLCDPDRLKAWLSDHPQDEPFLLKLLKGK
jgi:hypothetical protein